MSILGDDWFDSEITEEFLHECGFEKLIENYYFNSYCVSYPYLIPYLIYIYYSKKSDNLYISDKFTLIHNAGYKVYNRLDFLEILNILLKEFRIKNIENE